MKNFALFSLDYEKDRRKIALISFLTFIVAFVVAFLPYFVRGKAFVWDIDGTQQHNPFMEYIIEKGGLKNLGKYDFKVGFGGDFLFAFAYYMLLDPFNILYYIFPFFSATIVYSLIVVAKFLVIYYVMFLYLKHNRVAPPLALSGAISYMLVGWSLFSVPRHPQFAIGLIFFPLICWGMENVLAKKRPYLLIISIFLCCVSNYYQFYICAFCAVFYFIFYKISVQEKFVFKSFVLDALKVFCFALIGVLLSAFLLVPVGIGMLSSARGASKGFDLLGGISIFNFVSILSNLFVPIDHAPHVILGFNVALLFCLCLFVFGKNKSKGVFWFFTIMLFVPFFWFATNVFNYSSGRWLFVYAFVSIVCATSALGEMNNEKDHNKKEKALKLFFSILIMLAFLSLALLCGRLLISKNSLLAFLLSVAFAILGVGALVLFVKKAKMPNKLIKVLNYKNLVLAMIIVPIVVAFGYNIYYSSQFLTPREADLRTDSERYVATQNLGKFYRVDIGENFSSNNRINRNIPNDYMATFLYNSSSSGSTFDFLFANGLANRMGTLGSPGMESRVALQALMSANYYIASDNNIPYGFEKVEGYDNLYYNKNCLDFGVFYSNTVSEKFANELPIGERANLMLEALILEDGASDFAYSNANTNLNFSTETQNVKIDGKKISAGKNASIKLHVEGCANKEVYLNLKDFGVDFDDVSLSTILLVGKTDYDFEINTAERQLHYRSYSKGKQMYNGEQNDYCINLGYIQENDLDVEIVLPNTKWLCSEISFSGYDMGRFEQNVENLKQNSNFSLKDFEHFDGNTLRGNIENENDGYLFLSIPYSSGWTAKVDGKTANILKANYGFMAIELDGGVHEIELNYSTPGFRAGKILSLAGLGTLLAVVGVDIVVVLKRKKKVA